MEIIKEIIPDAKDYNFRFGKDACDKEKYGVCPVVEYADEIRISLKIPKQKSAKSLA